ncbi:MAG: hypothetical protein R2741_06245 [Methanolobus sp.]
MSELPWENKKVSEAMSSAGEESRLNDSPDSDKNKVSIPDILANAFSDVSMEEVKIEDSIPAAEGTNPPVQDQVSLPFGDLPDLSSLSNNGEQETASSPEPSSLPGNLPPFMSEPASPEPQLGAGMNLPGSKPVFEFQEPGSRVTSPGSDAGQSGQKRSPPPLFEPSFLFDESDANSESTDAPSSPEAPPVPFPTNEAQAENQFPPGLPSIESPSGVAPDAPPANPFETAPSVDAPANPFESAPPVDAPVNPFESAPSGAPPVNPFEVAPPVDAPVNPFEVAPPVDAPVNPFESAPSGAPPVNPFESAPSGAPPVNPFEVAASDDAPVNSFESAPSGAPPANPFEVTPSGAPPANPFAQASTAGEISASSGSKLKGAKVPVNVDMLKKNFGSISAAAKGPF